MNELNATRNKKKKTLTTNPFNQTHTKQTESERERECVWEEKESTTEKRLACWHGAEALWSEQCQNYNLTADKIREAIDHQPDD